MGSLFSIGKALIDFFPLQKGKAIKGLPPHAYQGNKFLVSQNGKNGLISHKVLWSYNFPFWDYFKLTA